MIFTFITVNKEEKSAESSCGFSNRNSADQFNISDWNVFIHHCCLPVTLPRQENVGTWEVTALMRKMSLLLKIERHFSPVQSVLFNESVHGINEKMDSSWTETWRIRRMEVLGKSEKYQFGRPRCYMLDREELWTVNWGMKNIKMIITMRRTYCWWEHG